MDEKSEEVEALSILKSFSEDDLRTKVVEPLFRYRRWSVEDLDEKDEVHHGCDLLLKGSFDEQPILLGVQLKVREGVSTSHYIVKTILPLADLAIAYGFGDGRVERITRFLWITTGSISKIGRGLLSDELEKRPSLKGRVDVWGIGELYQELRRSGAMREIGPLRIPYAKIRIKEHRRAGEGVFAAHWCYRAFRDYLLKKSPELHSARECLAEGIECLKQDRWKRLYFSRVLRMVFEGWIEVMERLPHLFRSTERLELILLNLEVVETFERKLKRGWLVTLLIDFECIFRQFVQLEDRYADSPAGLSTLLVCRLLLRSGVSPTEERIAARLQRIKDELKSENGLSVDDQCSLCTGVVLSCFSLARERKVVRRPAKWILGLRDIRYCHNLPRSVDLPAEEHALHYAASALLGFLDLGTVSDEELRPVIEVFFQGRDLDARGFILDWVKYSHVDRFEVYRFILATFLRYLLMGKDLSDEQKAHLREAIGGLAKALREDSPPETKTYIFYSTRTNLSSFVLGMLLGVDEATKLARAISGLFHRRALVAGERRDGQLWDSNVERTVAFIESLLEYWETIIFLHDSGQPVTDLLPKIAPPQDDPGEVTS